MVQYAQALAPNAPSPSPNPSPNPNQALAPNALAFDAARRAGAQRCAFVGVAEMAEIAYLTLTQFYPNPIPNPSTNPYQAEMAYGGTLPGVYTAKRTPTLALTPT